MGQLIDIDEWGLGAADLSRLHNVATVQIGLTYPDYRALVQYKPRERLKRIDAHYRHDYQRLLALLSAGEMEMTGTQRRPTGVRVQLPLQQLPALLQHEFIGSIMVSKIEGMAPQLKAVEESRPSFWCIEARFAVQIEDETKGLQLYEDRMLIITADSEAEAKKKLAADFEAYAKPYLNSAGRLVRWQFEAFLDTYRVDIESVNEFAGASGVEVFSKLKRRRIRPDREWLPKH
ncbi:DUF4288 domain-containing protein [Hymenobacter jeollabukensis]|uniref:DUF4288 domain-containing protein n=1 Tax=Hymenobacter jeollabukensis TaxID=2025313 RepID=A0A5R8WLB4_9BACT|nr:DUF4288 domain-containing protein [Hymenobacter jeollabukensis]TLM89467.1 DUF4288 domain-containing protein [Hymenobacter jeollabukensis]